MSVRSRNAQWNLRLVRAMMESVEVVSGAVGAGIAFKEYADAKRTGVLTLTRSNQITKLVFSLLGLAGSTFSLVEYARPVRRLTFFQTRSTPIAYLTVASVIEAGFLLSVLVSIVGIVNPAKLPSGGVLAQAIFFLIGGALPVYPLIADSRQLNIMRPYRYQPV